MNINQKGFANIILIVVIVAVFVGVVGYFVFGKKSEQATQQQQTTTQTKPKDESANWKSYRNEEYGFEFKYPTGWEIIDESYTGGFPESAIEDRPWIVVHIEGPGRYGFPGLENTRVSYRILITDPERVRQLRLIADFGSDVPAQTWWNADINQEVVEDSIDYKVGSQIISTFKFINK